MPETVIMMLNRCIWLPLIHIMKHMKPTFLKTPCALPYNAVCFASNCSISLELDTVVDTCMTYAVLLQAPQNPFPRLPLHSPPLCVTVDWEWQD